MEPSSQGEALVKQLTAIDQGRREQFDEQDHSESTEHVASLHYCCRNFDSVQFHTPINIFPKLTKWQVNRTAKFKALQMSCYTCKVVKLV